MVLLAGIASEEDDPRTPVMDDMIAHLKRRGVNTKAMRVKVAEAMWDQ